MCRGPRGTATHSAGPAAVRISQGDIARQQAQPALRPRSARNAQRRTQHAAIPASLPVGGLQALRSRLKGASMPFFICIPGSCRHMRKLANFSAWRCSPREAVIARQCAMVHATNAGRVPAAVRRAGQAAVGQYMALRASERAVHNNTNDYDVELDHEACCYDADFLCCHFVVAPAWPPSFIGW